MNKRWEITEQQLEGIRVVLFDVYGTLLLVKPRPEKNHFVAGWWERHFAGSAPESLDARIDGLIASAHRRARDAGVAFPEIQWPQIVRQALCEEKAQRRNGAKVEEISPDLLEDLAAGLAACQHEIELRPGTANLLRFLQERHLPLGIISNAQSYTLRELQTCLTAEGILAWPFEDAWCFWSWKFGFSKPSPAVFQIFSARAEALGWKSSQILYFGDRADNDIEPAKKAGWRTIQVTD
jgi:FMN phosphatase YigB (HAD superfamily)